MRVPIFSDYARKNWVTSDLHLGHQQPFIWQKRGYANYIEHDNAVINKINEFVGTNDNLFSLGDFCLNTDENQFESFISRINCQNIYLIWGNHHNPIYKIYKRQVINQYQRDDIEVYPLKYKNLNIVGHHFECIINHKYVVMNHFPISVWEGMSRGSYMLCGHSHYTFLGTKAETKDGLILDCGWDGHVKPLSFKEIQHIMENKQVKVVDHHLQEKTKSEFFD